MAFENLDFSGWKSGNSALAKANIDSTTTKAKAKASQTAGLTAGIGTVIGAIFGGPYGAAIGNSIGSSLSGGSNNIGEDYDRYSDLSDSWEDAFSRSATKKKKGTPFGGEKNQGDIMQLASNYNMIDENGNVQPTFLKFIKDIGYFG